MLHLIYTDKMSIKNADGRPQFKNISYSSEEIYLFYCRPLPNSRIKDSYTVVCKKARKIDPWCPRWSAQRGSRLVLCKKSGPSPE